MAHSELHGKLVFEAVKELVDKYNTVNRTAQQNIYKLLHPDYTETDLPEVPDAFTWIAKGHRQASHGFYDAPYTYVRSEDPPYDYPNEHNVLDYPDQCGSGISIIPQIDSAIRSLVLQFLDVRTVPEEGAAPKWTLNPDAEQFKYWTWESIHDYYELPVIDTTYFVYEVGGHSHGQPDASKIGPLAGAPEWYGQWWINMMTILDSNFIYLLTKSFGGVGGVLKLGVYTWSTTWQTKTRNQPPGPYATDQPFTVYEYAEITNPLSVLSSEWARGSYTYSVYGSNIVSCSFGRCNNGCCTGWQSYINAYEGLKSSAFSDGYRFKEANSGSGIVDLPKTIRGISNDNYNGLRDYFDKCVLLFKNDTQYTVEFPISLLYEFLNTRGRWPEGKAAMDALVLGPTEWQGGPINSEGLLSIPPNTPNNTSMGATVSDSFYDQGWDQTDYLPTVPQIPWTFSPTGYIGSGDKGCGYIDDGRGISVKYSIEVPENTIGALSKIGRTVCGGS